jgi:hypothetical protein
MLQNEVSPSEINLAVYMERLDAYIASQTALNNTLCEGLEKVQNQVTEMAYWRHRMLGAKTVVIALGVLIVHTSAVMGGFLALINYMNL